MTRYRIAVIGSGIAGLSATWRLGRNHRISVYERAPALGMAAHGWKVESRDVVVDVPIRVMYAEYYPVLLSLLAEAGVETRPLDGSASFTELGRGPIFRYRNLRFNKLSLPVPWGLSTMSRTGAQIVSDYLRLSRAAGHPEGFEDLTLGEYLAKKKYSQVFVEKMLLPLYATLCTCTYDQVRAFPAKVILEYLGKGLNTRSIRKAVGGAGAVVKALSTRASEILFGAEVSGIERHEAGIDVVDPIHGRRTYDHVVVATQSNDALKLVADITAEERSVLAAFSYTPIEVVMHTDRRLMPRERRRWSPSNYLIHQDWDRPMATLWVNRVYGRLSRDAPLLQTVHPMLEPEAKEVLSSVKLQRPVVTLDSRDALSKLDRLHGESDRRLWFCGSYAMSGIPLLESAAGSAVRVAELIQASELPLVDEGAIKISC